MLIQSSFSLAIYLPPYHRRSRKVAIVLAYMAFLSITLIPTLLLASESTAEQGWDSSLLAGALVYLIAPLVQLLGVIAFFAQARTTIATRGRQEENSLSVQGLFGQAVVFALVGVSFMFRLKLPAKKWKYYIWNVLREWYWLVGWATLNNCVFAVAQGVLGWIAVRQRRWKVVEGGDVEPLLGEQRSSDLPREDVVV
jgi:hypothetical protein